ncbi:hypothetical protein BDF19DRAFT_497633 [Syncephalis fuscata]|nr:hypothetical protein BDF19DRAFT_497633 [Syncephalis fuscata]
MSIISLGSIQTGRLATLPPDVLLRLLVLLEFNEVGRLATVCRTFHSMAPVALYLQLHHDRQSILKLELHVRGASGRFSVPLRATVFDPMHKVVEFRCIRPIKLSTAAATASIAEKANIQLQTGDRYNLQFQPWQPPIVLTDRAEDKPGSSDATAKKLFHERYHPFAETEYRCRKGYVGDARVLARWRSVTATKNEQDNKGEEKEEGDSNQPSYCELVWLRVSLAYILAGQSKSPVLPGPMYPERVCMFNDALTALNRSDYNQNDQIYLGWLAGDMTEQLESIIPQIAGYSSLRQQVEQQLESTGISPTCLWKYGFAKRFVNSDVLLLGNTAGSGGSAAAAAVTTSEWTVASVVERIVAAEKSPTNPHSIINTEQQQQEEEEKEESMVHQESLAVLIRSAFGNWWSV